MSVLVVVPHPEQVPFSRVGGCAGALSLGCIGTSSTFAGLRVSHHRGAVSFDTCILSNIHPAVYSFLAFYGIFL